MLKWIKAIGIGMQILAAIEQALTEYQNPTGEEIYIPPIYITKNGRKWMIAISATCLEE